MVPDVVHRVVSAINRAVCEALAKSMKALQSATSYLTS